MSTKANKIHHINDGSIDLSLKNFIVFNDDWICEIFDKLFCVRTGKLHDILEVKYHIVSEWDDPDLIQYRAARMIEKKRTAVRISGQDEIELTDIFYAIRSNDKSVLKGLTFD